MNETKLYKFVNVLEYHWYDDGRDCILTKDNICIWMKDICEYYDIDICNIFEKENS